jgi:hypothetical protein
VDLRIFVPLPHPEVDPQSSPGPRGIERVTASELVLANRKSPCVIGCLHVMYQPDVRLRQEGPYMDNMVDGEEDCDNNCE